MEGKIDMNNVHLLHFIDEEQYEENLNSVIPVGDTTATKNNITLPDYKGKPIKHTLIIEFTQVK
jgi:hypothetical protein